MDVPSPATPAAIPWRPPPRAGAAAPQRPAIGWTAALVLAGACQVVVVVGIVALAPSALHPTALVALVAAAAVLGHLPLAVLVEARVFRPLRELRDASARARRAHGEAAVTLPANAHPDLARVARSFQRLLDAMTGDRRRLREVAARAIRAQETERARIARQLQEETAQSLAALLFHLRAARATEDARAHDAMLDEVRAALSETTDTVRRFARGLHPPALEELGVGAAVEAYAAALTDHGGPRIEVRADDVRPLLGRERELSLFRILQEALGNTVRHASASTVRVEIAAEDGVVRATVTDDGRGFAVEETEASLPCLGLFGLRERALYAGGSARVESAPGRGTTVRVEMPGSQAPAAAPAWPVILPGAARG
jgi:two-component system, NarL family, sensor histidine kinase UhpB